MGRRPITTENVPEPEITSDTTNGDVSAEPRAPLTSAQRIAASTASTNETVAVPFALEAKYFTEIRVLNRDVSSFLLKCIKNIEFISISDYCAGFIGSHCSGRC